MIKNATSQELMNALKIHLAEIENHVIRLVDVFESINKKAVAKKCEALDGLIRESVEIMELCQAGAI